MGRRERGEFHAMIPTSGWVIIMLICEMLWVMPSSRAKLTWKPKVGRLCSAQKGSDVLP